MTIYTSEKPSPYVYRLDNPTTGEFYIGYRKANKLPSNLDLPIYKTSAPEIENSFEYFEWKIIAEFFDGDDAYDFEQLCIFEEWFNPLLLNKSCFHNKGKFRNTSPHSEKTKEKMRNANRPTISDETRLKISIAQTGKIVTEETIQKMIATKIENGTLNSMRNPDSIQKRKDTCKERGVENPMRNPDSIQKRKDTCKERGTGMDNPLVYQKMIDTKIRNGTLNQPQFLSLISNKKTYTKGLLSRWYPHFKIYY